MTPSPWAILKLYRRAARALDYGRAHGLPGMEFAARRASDAGCCSPRAPAGDGVPAQPGLLDPLFRVPVRAILPPIGVDPLPGRRVPATILAVRGRYPSGRKRADDQPRSGGRRVDSPRQERRRTRAAQRPRRIVGRLPRRRRRRTRGRRRRQRKIRSNGGFDCIWCISVIEHVAGAYDNREAIRMMWDVLKPGGRLIVTTMVNRTFSARVPRPDAYGTQSATQQGSISSSSVGMTSRRCGTGSSGRRAVSRSP